MLTKSINHLRIVIDTNVLIAALRSRNGASYRLLMCLENGQFEAFISVPLFAEYEAVAQRLASSQGLSMQAIEDILDYICLATTAQSNIYYLWRPMLRDPADEMVLELAVAAECDYIVTFNQSDFVGCEKFGVSTIPPLDFLKLIGEL